MSEGRTVSQLMRRARQKLEAVSDTPSLDSQLLMMRTIGRPRGWLLAHPEYELTDEQVSQYEQYVGRCSAGEALPYVLGWWEFYGRQFHLSPAVLIPRPETEHLVEVALGSLLAKEGPSQVLDVGTGSGCIVVTLALEMPENRYAAVDISRPALEVAQRNLQEYRLEESVQLIQADMLRPLAGPVDMIVANLPYIRQEKLATLDVAAREPGLALAGGEDGLEYVRQLAAAVPRVLARGGEVILELDPEQMESASQLLQSAAAWRAIEVHPDLSGRSRVLHATGAN